MDDLISRQAALDALDKRFDNIPMEQTAEILKLRKDLRELPTIQPEVLACGNGELIAQPEPQWIPVSERLPEKGGEYLVSVHHTIGAISVFHPEKDTYVDDVAIMKYYGKFPSTVRAWMPMPEAYKEGGEKI